MRLLIATHNHGKVREYRQLLYGLPHQLLSLDDVGIVDDVPETGHTYAENALLKARAYAQQSGLLTLADDSGLEVDALNGAPGRQSWPQLVRRERPSAQPQQAQEESHAHQRGIGPDLHS